MRLIKTRPEMIATSSIMSYTPLPLQHEHSGVYTLWEPKRLIEFRYEVN